MHSFEAIKESAKRSCFDFSKAAKEFDTSPEIVRKAFASKTSIQTPSPIATDTPPPVPPSTRQDDGVTPIIPQASRGDPINFDFDVEKEMKAAEDHLSKQFDQELGKRRSEHPKFHISKTKSKSTEKIDSWSFDKWQKEQEAAEKLHKERNELAFKKALASLGGSNIDLTEEGIDLSSLPPEIAAAVQERRDNELLANLEKKEAEDARKQREEIEKTAAEAEEPFRPHQ